MGTQYRLRDRRPVVRLPGRVPETATHGLAIQVQPPSDLGNRDPLFVKQSSNLHPALLIHHMHLPKLVRLGMYDPRISDIVKSHRTPPSDKRVGRIQ